LVCIEQQIVAVLRTLSCGVVASKGLFTSERTDASVAFGQARIALSRLGETVGEGTAVSRSATSGEISKLSATARVSEGNALGGAAVGAVSGGVGNRVVTSILFETGLFTSLEGGLACAALVPIGPVLAFTSTSDGTEGKKEEGGEVSGKEHG
jgi:hypothetical protein